MRASLLPKGSDMNTIPRLESLRRREHEATVELIATPAIFEDVTETVVVQPASVEFVSVAEVQRNGWSPVAITMTTARARKSGFQHRHRHDRWFQRLLESECHHLLGT